MAITKGQGVEHGIYRVPEEVLQTLPDGRTIQLAAAGTEMPLAEARRLGLVKDEQTVGPSETKAGPGQVSATDSATKLAAEYGLELSTVAGTGKGGNITKADVEKALEAQGDAGPYGGNEDAVGEGRDENTGE